MKARVEKRQTKFAEVVRRVQATKEVTLAGSIPLVYMADGEVPKLPVAEKFGKGAYKTPHWVPVVFWAKDHPAVADKPKNHARKRTRY